MTVRPTDSLVAPLQKLAQNWQNSTENSRNITVVNGLLPEPKGYTLIVACRDQEFAYEDVFEGTERNAKYEWLKSFLELPNGIPSHDTFSRVFARIEPQQFQEYFLS